MPRISAPDTQPVPRKYSGFSVHLLFLSARDEVRFCEPGRLSTKPVPAQERHDLRGTRCLCLASLCDNSSTVSAIDDASATRRLTPQMGGLME
jgi:hypothetical protein